jgi:hypothetical protein
MIRKRERGKGKESDERATGKQRKDRVKREKTKKE